MRPQTAAERLAEIEWLLESGESLERIAARIGIRPNSVETLCRRHGRLDLIAKITDRRHAA